MTATGLADVPPAPLPFGGLRLPAIAAAWLAFGLLAGIIEYLTVARALGLGWMYVLRGPVLASAIWIPLTLGAVWVARRRPLLPVRPRRLLLHLGLAAAASFALNLAWGGLHAAFGAQPWPARGFLSGAAWAGLRNLHLNAGTYAAIVLFVTLSHRRRADAGGGVARARDDGGSPHTPADAGLATRPESPGNRWARTLSVRVGSRTVIVPVEEIDRIEGAGDYVRLHAGERRYLMAERMKTLERRLDPAVFARVHRSTIVNLTRIAELEHRSHGDYEARLEDGSTVRVSRSRTDAIRDLL